MIKNNYRVNVKHLIVGALLVVGLNTGILSVIASAAPVFGWTQDTTLPLQAEEISMVDVAFASDSAKVVAATNAGSIFTSLNGGQAWTER